VLTVPSRSKCKKTKKGKEKNGEKSDLFVKVEAQNINLEKAHSVKLAHYLKST
jgi:hypothetical protein